MTPRSYLYVPGDRPEMLAKAATRGADALIVDLEDAVAEARKADARRIVERWLRTTSSTGPEIWIRINNHPALEDLAVVRDPVTGVVVPKADGPGPLDRLAGRVPPGCRIIALIETATGVLRAPEIAAHESVVRLAMGEADLAADLGISPSRDRRELDPLRLQMVVASVAAGIDGPIAPVSTDIRDLSGLEHSTRALMRLGFAARTAVHPDQVRVINRVFTPTEADVAEARALVEAAERAERAGAGVFLDEDGRVVDEAVVRGARRTLARADRTREDSGSGSDGPHWRG